MSIIVVIGTRPQYIKLKPLYDYLINNKINSCIIDTNQHYSDNVSKNLIEELGLKIDYNLKISFNNEMSFISNGVIAISDMFEKIYNKGDVVVVMGDTNSTLVSSLVAKKMGIRFAHIEAGVRCHDFSSPEEINRVLVDSIADIHFTSREKDKQNVSNPIYVGDLEYNFLNNIESKYENISYDFPILMTIHRQENMFKDRLESIFDFCKKINNHIIFPIHHRTKKFVSDNKIFMPKNIEIVDPLSFFEIISVLRTCRAIITDSGGITKIAPFFGKRCIVPMDKWEWDEVFEKNFATNKMDSEWFNNYKIERDKNLYYVDNSCEIIVDNILNNKG